MPHRKRKSRHSHPNDASVFSKSFLRSIADMAVMALVLAFFIYIVKRNEISVLAMACFASSALSMVALPTARTNSIRAIFLAYIIAAVCSSFFAMLFSYTNFEFPGVIFIKFFIVIFFALVIFVAFEAIHPPAVGATLSLFFNTSASDGYYLVFYCLIIGCILMLIKTYLYMTNPTVLKKENFKKEFTRNFMHNPNELLHFSAAPTDMKKEEG